MAYATQTTSLSGSGIVVPDGAARIVGVMVSTSTSLTLKFWDEKSGTGTVLMNTTAAITAPVFWPVKFSCTKGCFCTFGGTGTITVYWERG